MLDIIDTDGSVQGSGAVKLPFVDLDLPEPLLRAIHDLGFSHCTPIQERVLCFTLKGHDALGKAQTGTGKTAAFLITIINDLIRNPGQGERFAGDPRALILAPTRELALQIAKDAHALAKYTAIKILSLLGGMDYDRQRQTLMGEVVDIVVATPGRLLDFVRKKAVYLDQVEHLVIDEADRMLDMGFIPDVKQIVRACSPKTHRQTLLFSATFTQDVINLAGQWTQAAVRVEIEAEAEDVLIDQRVYIVSNDEKVKVLFNLIQQNSIERIIVFANRRDQVRLLTDTLKKYRIGCALLSGEITQDKRIKTLESFRQGKIKVLVATDVAGRGIHVEGISHVVNYTLPEQVDDYIHRIGRTGRAGASGISISFASEDDAFMIPAIEQALSRKLVCEHPPQELLTELPPRSAKHL